MPMSQLMPHQLMSARIAIYMDLTANVSNSKFKILTKSIMKLNSVKQHVEERKNNSTLPLKECNSDNNTNQKRKPNFAETSKCMENANSVTTAHMLTENTSSKRKPTFQATS